MAESPRRVDLRLTIPAAAPYHAVAGEVAGKFAEYSGADATVADHLAKAVEEMTTKMSDGGLESSIDLAMKARGAELTVDATTGSNTDRATCPLPD